MSSVPLALLAFPEGHSSPPGCPVGTCGRSWEPWRSLASLPPMSPPWPTWAFLCRPWANLASIGQRSRIFRHAHRRRRPRQHDTVRSAGHRSTIYGCHMAEGRSGGMFDANGDPVNNGSCKFLETVLNATGPTLSTQVVGNLGLPIPI